MKDPTPSSSILLLFPWCCGDFNRFYYLGSLGILELGTRRSLRGFLELCFLFCLVFSSDSREGCLSD